MMNEAPWWWFEGGTEICSICEQSYAYQAGTYCIDCDANVCLVCVQESEANEPVCFVCCSEQ